MLSPDKLDKYPQALIELYAQVEADIIADMAARISAFDMFIPAAQFQFEKLKEMGMVHDEIIKRLSAITGKTDEELKKIITDAGAASILGGPAYVSPALSMTLGAGLRNTQGLFTNLTGTTANTATKQFEHALDRAWMQINSGAFSANEAIAFAIKDLSGKGLKAIEYPSGHTDYLDTAVRRAAVTGVNNASINLVLMQAAELGCDLVEVSAHSGARTDGSKGPSDHAYWQGKIYSISGKHPKYPSLFKCTGLGTGEGLGGWNCRHTIFLYFEGVSEPKYTNAELEEMNAPKYEYNGVKMTEYEARQRQRTIERNIRKYKREFMAMDSAGLNAAPSAASLAKWREIEKDFLGKTGLKKDYSRSWVNKFGRSAAGKASSMSKLPKSVIDFDLKNSAMSVSELLPNYINAVIPSAKLSGYALNESHPTGKHKAVAFRKYLGYNIDNEATLIMELRKGLSKYKARAKPETGYGKPFEIKMMLKGANGKYAHVKSGWIYDNDSEVPRLTSVYIDE